MADSSVRVGERRSTETSRRPILGRLSTGLRGLRDWLATLIHIRSILARKDEADDSFRRLVSGQQAEACDEAIVVQSILVALDREHQDSQRALSGTVFALSEQIQALHQRVADLEKMTTHRESEG